MPRDDKSADELFGVLPKNTKGRPDNRSGRPTGLSEDEWKLVKELREKSRYGVADAWVPRDKDEYFSDEKCHHFDQLHDLAKSIFDTIREKRYPEKDSHYYCYEKVMELLGKDVWGAINVYLK